MFKYVRIREATTIHDGLTKGKIYKAKPKGYSGNLFGIKSDHNSDFSIFIPDCAYLDGGSWEFVFDLKALVANANKSRLSTALGKHRSYLNKMIQQGVSEETYQQIRAKLTIDWSSDKPLYVNDRKHVPFTIKPINCTLPKHKEWLQNLMMQGCIKL